MVGSAGLWGEALCAVPKKQKTKNKGLVRLQVVDLVWQIREDKIG
jgi:hypothetical protein